MNRHINEYCYSLGLSNDNGAVVCEEIPDAKCAFCAEEICQKHKTNMRTFDIPMRKAFTDMAKFYGRHGTIKWTKYICLNCVENCKEYLPKVDIQ
jgi:hypothetical protein